MRINIELIPGGSSGDLTNFVGRIWEGFQELDGDVVSISSLPSGIFAATTEQDTPYSIQKTRIYKFNESTLSFELKSEIDDTWVGLVLTASNMVENSSGQIFVAIDGGDRIYRSDDNGETFNQITTASGTILARHLSYNTETNTLWASGSLPGYNNSVLRHSTDGVTWSEFWFDPAPGGNNGAFGSVVMGEKSLIFPVGSPLGCKIWEIFDSGTSFPQYNGVLRLTDANYTLPTPPVKNEYNHLFVALMNADASGTFAIYKSINNGVNWEKISESSFGAQVNNSYVSSVYYANNHGYLLSLPNNQLLLFGPKILRSQDGGRTWKTVQEDGYWRWADFAFGASVVAGKNSIPGEDNAYSSVK